MTAEYRYDIRRRLHFARYRNRWYRSDMLPVVLMFAILQPPTLLEPRYRGSQLYKDCKAAVRVADNDGPPDYASGLSCFNYIDGFTDGMDFAGSRAICVGTASFATMARVYVAYMDKHPTFFDEKKMFGLLAALIDTYPCPK